MDNCNVEIDFNLINQAVSMEMLLEQFSFSKVCRRGNEVRIKCPFHQGKSDDSMAINFSKNTFYCFGCKSRGNVLDFVAKYEDCTIRDAALRLNKLFGIQKEISDEGSLIVN